MDQKSYSAWNPGIESEIPPAYRELETIYNPENVFTTLAEVNELAAETGISPEELISFRPHRLVLHELIVRITADIVVLEGEYEEDLGINFRTIARKIFSKYVIPNLMQIEHSFETMRTRIEDMTLQELETALVQKMPAASVKPSFWSRFSASKPKPSAAPQSRQEREFELINNYKQRGLNAEDKLSQAVYRSLYRVLGSIATTRGFVGNDPGYLKNICVRHACNYLGSREIGSKVGKLVNEAITNEGYERIADAEKPILIRNLASKITVTARSALISGVACCLTTMPWEKVINMPADLPVTKSTSSTTSSTITFVPRRKIEIRSHT
jgi:hypothetical protein